MPPKTPNDAHAEMAAKMRADFEKEKAALIAENEALKAAKAGNGKMTMKVSELGAMSIYGMGRFPTTLYRPQWEAILAKAEEVKAFLAQHAASLSTGKDDPRFLKVRADRAAKAGTASNTAGSADSVTAPNGKAF